MTRNNPVSLFKMETVPYHILATSSRTDDRTRVLKQADTFAVFDYRGDIEPGGLGEQGLYHEGTRFLSCLSLDLDGGRPFVLNSTVRHENDQLVVVLSNPDLLAGGRIVAPFGALCITTRKFLWKGVCYQQIQVKNHALESVEAFLSIRFQSDFADIFEVRGMKRKARGRDLDPEVCSDRVVLGYEGLDDTVRRTLLKFSPTPSSLEDSLAWYRLSLQSQEEMTFFVSAACERASVSPSVSSFDAARVEAQTDLERFSAWSCHVQTSNSHFNAWFNRAVSDLHMLTTELPTGPYPYAGVPWFNTPFGRDGIITALESLWLRPALARGVLAYLAATQATEHIPEQDAEPGKILHETRCGEMAVLKEMPFGRYYGSVDATPLFVVLAGAYYKRTGDGSFLDSIWPNIDAALKWIDCYGDRDEDGFVEYQRDSRDGLIHQGWKDSDDAVFHNDGAIATGPIALCEVQGYVYAARKAGAAIAAALGMTERSSQLEAEAASMRERFDRTFWCEELSTYVLALDGDKRPCRVRSSNAGQCLFTGIVAPDRADRLVRTLLSHESFAGWGIRTIPATEVRYNPMGYHTGAIWPHDNALIAQGLARYGFPHKAGELLTGLFEASLHFDLHRMPELFCGFEQIPGEGPILYPLACSPQSWSAASVCLLLQACLGLEIDAIENHVRFIRPYLPPALQELRIHNLAVGQGMVDLLLVRHENDLSVTVLHREGNVEVMVIE
jgi:glycogen debranching enzyme